MSEQLDITTSEKAATAPQAMTVPSTMKALVEALIFAAEEPLSIRQLKALYEFSAPAGSGEERRVEADALRGIIADLNAEYKKAGRPYRIIQLAGGYQFATLKEYADWVGKLRREQSRKKLSQSGIETLAIISYKQPITKAEVESIRGVNCDYVLKTLLEKDLVRVTGRAETVGRPLLYGTTRDFLVHFGLNEITDLPRPREIEEILGESQFETERRMLEAQEAADKLEHEEEPFKSRLPHIPKRKPALEESPVEIRSRQSPTAIKTASYPSTGAVERPGEPGPQESKSHDSPEVAAPSLPLEQIHPTPAPDVHVISAPESVSPPPEVVLPQGPEEQATARETVPETKEGRKTRWHAWKEKIQGFIRRLFD